MVARRILDSLTPGWEQIGAVWLPLPHLLNMVPVQVDLFYRTGLSAIAMSVLALGLSATLHRWRSCCGSPARRMGGAHRRRRCSLEPQRALPARDADDRAAAVRHDAHVRVALHRLGHQRRPRRPAPSRLVDGGRAASRATKRGRRRRAGGAGARRAGGAAARRRASSRARLWQLARYPIGAADLLPVPEPGDGRRVVRERRLLRARARRCGTAGGRLGEDPRRDTRARRRGGWSVSRSEPLAVLGYAALRWRQGAALLVPLGRSPAAALPFSAFLAGHPFRIRYEIPLVVACGAGDRPGRGPRAQRRTRRGRVAAVLLVASDATPLDLDGADDREAQLDRANGLGRQAVTACLRTRRIAARPSSPSMGVARPLHAGALLHRPRHPRFPARGQSPDVGRGDRERRRTLRRVDARGGSRRGRRRHRPADPRATRTSPTATNACARAANVALYRRRAQSRPP